MTQQYIVIFHNEAMGHVVNRINGKPELHTDLEKAAIACGRMNESNASFVRENTERHGRLTYEIRRYAPDQHSMGQPLDDQEKTRLRGFYQKHFASQRRLVNSGTAPS